MQLDPICKMSVDENKTEYKSNYQGKNYYFCSESCKKEFDKNPEKYIKLNKPKNGNIKPIGAGIAGSLILLTIYFLVVSLTNYKTPGNIIANIIELWYWVLILSAGFGLQVGLYFYIKNFIKQKGKLKTQLAASGTISTGSMIACCAHNIAALLPLIGLSALSLFVVQFQLPIILLGFFSNLIGLTVMLAVIKKHQLYNTDTLLSILSWTSWKIVRVIVIVMGVFAISFFSATTYINSSTNSNNKIKEITLKTKTDSQNMVKVEVKPGKIHKNENITFNITFNTHVVDLGFELTEIAELIDNNGKIYKAINWDGDPPGGHHRKGTLIFTKLDASVESIKLILKDINGVSERIFDWELK